MPESLINLIASVDLEDGAGKILFVNPLGGAAADSPSGGTATAAHGAVKWRLKPTVMDVASYAMAGDPTVGAADVPQGFELLVEDAEGRELGRFHPSVKVSQCDLSPDTTSKEAEFKDHKPTTGIIDEVIPFIDGMKSVVLLHDGSEVDRFQAGSPSLGGGITSLSVSASTDGHFNRRNVAASGGMPEPGVTFTIQVRPDDAGAWQTIATGRDTPEINLDRNQFPGARRARVRVLRSTGFEDEVFAEEDVNLDF